jgi:hypothetical protein
MSLNVIPVVKSQGGLGRPQTGFDHYSGLVAYLSSLPAGLTANVTNGYATKLTQAKDAEALGIDLNYGDETKATHTFTAVPVSSVGAVVTMPYTLPNGTIVNLVTYTVGSYAADTTLAVLLASLVKAINLNTYSHGFVATASSTVLTLTVKAGLGIYPNTGTPVTYNVNGTAYSGGSFAIALGVTGVASRIAVIYYHLKEFFRANPLGILYLGLFTTNASFVELKTLADYADGQLRQAFVFNEATVFATSQVTALQAVVTTLETNEAPIEVLYSANFVDASWASYLSLPNLGSLTAPNVSIIIAQDRGGLGASLRAATGKSVSAGGYALGTVSRAKVQECIGATGRFDISDGTELELVGLSNDQYFIDPYDAALTFIDNSRYVFAIKSRNQNGTWFNDSNTSVTQSSDYAYIENNRTINKSIRLARIGLFPYIKSNYRLNSDGTISDTSISTFKNAVENALASMLTGDNPELSGYQVIVGTTPVIRLDGTSAIDITLKDLSSPVARGFNVTVGFTQKLS